MMDFITMQAPASRRALSIRPLLRHTFGHLPGDEPNSEEQACTGLGRRGDDYIGYPMKKCRSHTSMVQTVESVLGADDYGYVVTSAPDNTYCVIDTDCDADSACCERGGSPEHSCCCPHLAAPLQSTSSSTALSSAQSCVSSPSPPTLLGSTLTSECDTVVSCHQRLLEHVNPSLFGDGVTAGGGAATQPSHHHNHHHNPHHILHQQQQCRNSSATAAAGTTAAVESAAAEVDSGVGGVGGEGGSDLIGAFCAVTHDQWAAFRAAVSPNGVGEPAAVEGSAATAVDTGVASADMRSTSPQTHHHHHDHHHPQHHHHRHAHQRQVERALSDQRQCGPVAVAVANTAAATVAVAVASPQPSPRLYPDGSLRAVAALAMSSCLGSDGVRNGIGGGAADGDGGGTDGGSSSSIASLWAAVNSVAAAAVYDSTDDNVQAGLMLGHYRRWSNTIPNTDIAAMPTALVVPPSACTIVGGSCDGNQRRHHHDPPPPPRVPTTQPAVASMQRHPQHQPPRPWSTRIHSQKAPPLTDGHQRDHQLEMFLSARHSHHAGVPISHPAVLLSAQEENDGGRGGGSGGVEVLSQPGSPAPRAASCCAYTCSNSSRSYQFTAARNQILRDCYGGGDAVEGGSNGMTVDGSCSYGDGSGRGLGSGCIRAAAQVRSNAHSRFSVDLHHSTRLPYGQQQQQQQRAAAAAAAEVALAAQRHNAISPSRRRGGGAQSASYTTYGYRRACSSLAALERPKAAAAGGRGGGSSSDGDSDEDDDDSELEGTRLLTAFRTHTGMMTARSSGWGLMGGGTDSTPNTPSGAEAARRDPWATATASTTAAPYATTSPVAIGGGGGGGVGSGMGLRGSCHTGDGGGAGGTASGDGSGGSGEVAVVGRADGEGGGGVAEGGGVTEDAEEGRVVRTRSSYHLTNSHAAVELFLRLNHARQTMDFVKRQTQLFANLDKAQMTVWEALQTLNELREYETVLMAEAGEAQEVAQLSLLDHAFQTAELCRLHHPDLDWLHLVGLMHGLGKLLAHRRFGAQPQWAICGETYPLGCRFSPHILGSQYFTANPDRRRRLYNTPTGLYEPGCGLLNVVMSWSAPEYLYLVLMLNSSRLPQDALWVLRHAKFMSLTRPNSCYLPLCSSDDLRRLPLLRSFQSLAAYRKVELPDKFALRGEGRTAYYSGLIAKYIGGEPLQW